MEGQDTMLSYNLLLQAKKEAAAKQAAAKPKVLKPDEVMKHWVILIAELYLEIERLGIILGIIKNI